MRSNKVLLSDTKILTEFILLSHYNMARNTQKAPEITPKVPEEENPMNLLED